MYTQYWDSRNDRPLGRVSDALAGIVDPIDEELFWSRHYRGEPYIDATKPFEDYAPAYRLGIAYRISRDSAQWAACEPELQRLWDTHIWSELEWEQALPAVRAAWTRVDNAFAWLH